MTFTGPDISSHQHPPDRIDFGAVATAGHSFAIVKLTEGSSYSNPYGAQDCADARAAGLEVAPYHWVSPGAASVQLTNLVPALHLAGFQSGDLVWLDFEEAGATEDTLHGIGAGLEARGFRVGVYTFPYFWAQTGNPGCVTCPRWPLWFADYNVPANRAAPLPWSVVTLRQTNGTSVAIPGIPGLNDMSHAENGGEFIIWPHLRPMEDAMPRLVTEDGHLVYGIDGVGHAWHVPGMELEKALVATGIYGDGTIHPLPVGSIQTMTLVQ